jgi:hypothetical protein
MSTPYSTVCDIGGTDYGSRGVGYLRRLRLRPGPRASVLADIWLEIPSGTSYSFLPKPEVRLYYVNSSNGQMGGRYMGGFISDRTSGKVSGGTNRIAHLVAETYATELDYLVGDEATSIIVPSGTISTQIGQLLAAVNTGAPRSINYAIQATGTFTTYVLPVQYFKGRSLRYMLEKILANLDLGVAGVRARYHMGLDTTTGAVPFGDPKLYIYNAASPPPTGAATWQFSDSGIGGAVKPMYDPFWYEEEGGTLINKVQSTMALDGSVRTGTSSASMSAYPNPFSPTNNWQGLPFIDRESLTGAQATAVLARRLQVAAVTHLAIKFKTNERVLPNDWCAITWVPDGFAGAYYQVVGMDVEFGQSQEPWSTIICDRDGGASIVLSPVPSTEYVGAPLAAPPLAPEPASPPLSTRYSLLGTQGWPSPPGPPDPPTSLSSAYKGATPDGKRGVQQLAWAAPTDSSTLAYYEIQRRIDINKDSTAYTDWSAPERLLSSNVTYWHTSLDLGEQYEFRIRSVDNWGQAGAFSTSLVDTVEAPVYDDLPNPGFEILRAVKSSEAEGWAPTAGGTSIDTSTVYEGKQSLKLACGVAVTPEVTSRRVRCNVGKTYLLRFFAISTNAVPNRFNLKASWYDKSGAFLSASDVIANLTVPVTWTEETVKLTPPANAASVEFAPRLAPGTAYSVYLDAFTYEPQVATADLKDTSVTLAKRADRGASWPLSPAVDDEFYRTDLKRWGYWDGSNWLGASIISLTMHNYRGSPPWAATEEALACALPTDFAWRVVRWTMAYYVDGANDGANYWVFHLRRLDSTITIFDIKTFDTHLDAPSTWLNQASGSGFSNQPTTTDLWMQVFIETVGAPGPVYITNQVDVREVLS